MDLLSTFSFFWLLPITLISFGLGFYFYHKNSWLNEQAVWVKRTLPILRSLALFGLLVILLDLVLLFSRKVEDKPILVTVIDNSESMKQFKDSNAIQTQIAALIKDVKSRFDKRFDLAFYTIGSEFKNLNTCDLNEAQSRHEHAFKQLSEQYFNRNLSGIIFLSDGNFNSGESPTYEAENLNLTPVFPLGSGDIYPKKDQILQNLYYNDVVFLNDIFPIQVDIESYKIANKKAKLSLIFGGQIIESKTVTYKNLNSQFIQETFNVEAKKVGFQSYTVSLEILDGECNLKNNKKTCYIEVIDSRNEIAIVANSPHPDISALKSVVEGNENFKATFYTSKEFLQKNPKPNLLIWHDPNNQFDPNLLELINKNKIATLYIIGPQTSAQVINALQVMNLNNARNQSDETQGYFNSEFTAFNMSEDLKNQMEYFPPLTTKFGVVNPLFETDVLMYQKIGTTKKRDPLIYFGKRNNQTPFGVVFGEGLWRWKLQDFQKNQSHDLFNELFTKSIQYLLVKREEMGLSVQFEKRFSKSERIGVNANFYNASLEPITSPIIKMTITNTNGKKYLSQFNVVGNGYSLDLGKLPPGSYKWLAETMYNQKKYSKGGLFVIEDVSLEKNSNVANHGVLKQLAKNSNGIFNTVDNYKQTLDHIDKRDDMVVIQRIDRSFQNLIDSIFWLILLMTCLVAEWFIKRFYGAY